MLLARMSSSLKQFTVAGYHEEPSHDVESTRAFFRDTGSDRVASPRRIGAEGAWRVLAACLVRRPIFLPDPRNSKLLMSFDADLLEDDTLQSIVRG